MARITIPVTYNDGLDTWVKTYSTRRRADSIATSIREHGLMARVFDSGPRGKRAQRYWIFVRESDFTRALSLANHCAQVYDQIEQDAKDTVKRTCERSCDCRTSKWCLRCHMYSHHCECIEQEKG